MALVFIFDAGKAAGKDDLRKAEKAMKTAFRAALVKATEYEANMNLNYHPSFITNFGAISMADLPVNFMILPEYPHIGVISCPAPYIRKRILDYLRKCTEVKRCGRLFPFGAEIYFCMNEGHTPTETVDKICIICPMFIAEGAIRRSWIRRNFWLLWSAVLGLLCLLNTVDHIIEGSVFDSAVSWGIGMILVFLSLWNYAIGMKHEKALLEYVRERCIEEIKTRFSGRKA